MFCLSRQCCFLCILILITLTYSCRKKDINTIEDVGATVNITGTWEGSWTKTTAGLTFGGNLIMYFQQNDTVLSGTIMMMNNPCYLSEKPLHGTIFQQHITFNIEETTYISDFTGLCDQYGKVIGGTYINPVDCEGEVDIQGTFDLEKQ